MRLGEPERTLRKLLKHGVIEGFEIKGDRIVLMVREGSPVADANYVLFPGSFFRVEKIMLTGGVRALDRG